MILFVILKTFSVINKTFKAFVDGSIMFVKLPKTYVPVHNGLLHEQGAIRTLTYTIYNSQS